MLNGYRLTALAIVALVGCSGARSDGGSVEPSGGRRMALLARGDTVVYFEETRVVSVIVRGEGGPGDTARVTADEDKVIEVVRTGPDSLAAKFELLRIRMDLVGSSQYVERPELVDQTFLLVERDGRIRTVATPVPADGLSLHDAVNQFDDFFMPLPEAALIDGLMWGDTIEIRQGGGSAAIVRRIESRFHVVGDTTIHGVRAKVIEHESDITLSIASAGADSSPATMQGVERGTIVYAPDRRVMLARERHARVEGEMSGGGRTIATRRWFTVDSTIELLSPSDTSSTDPRQRPTPPVPDETRQ